MTAAKVGTPSTIRERLAVVVAVPAAIVALVASSQWLMQHAWLSEKYGTPVFCLRIGALLLAFTSLAAFAIAVSRGRARGLLAPSSARWTVVALTASLVVYFAFNERLRVLELVSYLCYGLGAVALWHLLRMARDSGAAAGGVRTRGRVLRGLELAAFSLAIALFLGELALRTWGYFAPSQLMAQDFVDYSAWVETQRRPPGIVHFGFPCNSEGNYDVDVPNAPRADPLVVSIGDSFSLGIVPHEFHYTTVAERALADTLPGIEVYNVGIPGAGPPHYLYLLRTQALPLRPDLIVVQLFLGNDVDAPGQPPPSMANTEFWFDRSKLMLWTVLGRIGRLRAAESARRPRHRPIGAIPGDKRAKRLLATVDEIVAAYPYVVDPLLEEPTFDPRSAFLEIEEERARAACGPDADYAGILDSLERLVVAAGNTPLAFVLIPDEFQVDDALWSEVAPTDGSFEPRKPQRIVSAWLEEHGVAYLDLLPILRAQPPLADGRLHVYHWQDTHFNARGNAVAGEALAAFVEEQLR